MSETYGPPTDAGLEGGRGRRRDRRERRRDRGERRQKESTTGPQGLQELSSGLTSPVQGFQDFLAQEASARNAPAAGIASAARGSNDALARYLGYLQQGAESQRQFFDEGRSKLKNDFSFNLSKIFSSPSQSALLRALGIR